MKPKASEYAVILLALATIFACGCAIGYLFGKSATQESIGGVSAQTGDARPGDWESRTLEKLSRALALTPEQRALVKKEITTASGEIAETKKGALRDYHRNLLALHDRILPHLDGEQRELMEKDRRSLMKLIGSE
jgi:hypothetical protein